MTHRLAWCLALALPLACSSESSSPRLDTDPIDDSGDTAADLPAPEPDATDVSADGDVGVTDGDVARDVDRPDLLANPCSADDLAACEYEPARLFGDDVEPAVEVPVAYTDVAGNERTVRIAVRRAADLVAPAPVVIWSHGGSGGQTQPSRVGNQWGRIFTRAGYVVVAIAHTPRSAAGVEGLCEALEMSDCQAASCESAATCSRTVGDVVVQGQCSDGHCLYWKPLNWDRPHDLAAVIDFLEDESAPGGRLDGVVDTSRLVYAGHSSGAGGTLMVAGATRQWAGVDHLSLDERPIAFLSCSPQGPGDDGFTEDSFTGAACRLLDPETDACLTRPHLYLTGEGDDTGGHDSSNRRASFGLLPASGKYLGWLTEEAGRHNTFNFGVDACERFARNQGLDSEHFPARCALYLRWLASAAVAFLDAVVRERPEARAYLASDNLSVLSGAALEWERR